MCFKNNEPGSLLVEEDLEFLHKNDSGVRAKLPLAQFNSVANKHGDAVVNIDCNSDCKRNRPAEISANRLFKAKAPLAVLKNKSAKCSPVRQETVANGNVGYLQNETYTVSATSTRMT